MRAYATARKTAADPLTVSRRNRASSNRVPIKSKKKGGGSRRNTSDKRDKRELLLATDGQQYAKLTKLLGDGRFEALCLADGVTRLARCRGKLWKRVWLVTGDLVLLGLRDFQDQKVDIVHKYSADEERTLASMGELPLTLSSQERNPLYQDQWTRMVDGDSRAGFLPSDAEFGFSEEADV